MSICIRKMLDRKGWGVAVLTRHQSISSAAQFLTANKIGAAPVVDEHGLIVGMLSERDIMRALGELGAEVLNKTAEDLMTDLVASCTPEATILDAMELMTNLRCRHIPVLVEGRLLGIISIGDIVKLRLEEAQEEVDSLRAYITSA